MVAVAQSLREQIAWACRILAAEGYADLTLGHISARGADGEIWIKRKGVALDEVEPEDVVTLDDPEAVLHLETVLHTGVYRARPDVGAVVHGHPPYATALGATGAELLPLTHDGILFADGVARFGDPDLIVDEAQGDRVAAALGSRRAVLMENHGVLVVGADVKWAVLSAVTLERAARLQAIASTLGELQPIEHELALQLQPVKYREEFVEEYWAAWQRRVTREGEGSVELACSVNGEALVREVEPQELLLDFLRDSLGLTGAKRSCDVQVCGACTVLVDGLPVSACCYLAVEANGRVVTTIEGLAERPEFDRLEEAFTRHAALQCGFCTPGMLLTVSALLEHGELPAGEEEIKQRLAGNLCRCTGYRGILEAVAELASV